MHAGCRVEESTFGCELRIYLIFQRRGAKTGNQDILYVILNRIKCILTEKKWILTHTLTLSLPAARLPLGCLSITCKLSAWGLVSLSM